MICKKYVVWYQGGSGGFITAWLLQLAHNHELFDMALRNFPLELSKSPVSWNTYEIIPPDIGVQNNHFHENKYLSKDEYVRQTTYSLNRLAYEQKEIQDLKDIRRTRINYILNNYIFDCVKQFDGPKLDYIYEDKSCRTHLKNIPIDLFYSLSDILYDKSKVIIVSAPTWYMTLCSETKASVDASIGCENSVFHISNMLIDYSSKLKIFNISSIWNDNYINEIENLLNISMNKNQKNACHQLVKRYMDIMPKNIKEIIWKKKENM